MHKSIKWGCANAVMFAIFVYDMYVFSQAKLEFHSGHA